MRKKCTRLRRMRFIIAIVLSVIALWRTDFDPTKVAIPLKDLQSDTYNVCLNSQPFYYLGKGRQCFVFESEDGKWVLKFFNKNYFSPHWYDGEKGKTKREQRRFFYENSYKLAQKEIGDGIAFVHWGKTEEHLPTILVHDKAQRVFAINLNDVPFVLQKKGSPFYENLSVIYQNEGNDGLYREIDCFIGKIKERIAKGIADGDSDVEHNWGYIEGELVQLDPGRLYIDDGLVETERRQIEWRRSTKSFYKWLKKNFPEGALHFNEVMKYVSHTP